MSDHTFTKCCNRLKLCIFLCVCVCECLSVNGDFFLVCTKNEAKRRPTKNAKNYSDWHALFMQIMITFYSINCIKNTSVYLFFFQILIPPRNVYVCVAVKQFHFEPKVNFFYWIKGKWSSRLVYDFRQFFLSIFHFTAFWHQICIHFFLIHSIKANVKRITITICCIVFFSSKYDLWSTENFTQIKC